MERGDTTMHVRRGTLAVLAIAGTTVLAGVLVAGGIAGPDVDFTNVPTANPKIAGYDPATVLSPELQEVVWARGPMLLDGGVVNGVKAYGDEDHGPVVPVMGTATGVGGSLTLQGSTHPEAQKTEPDKNTYLVLEGQKGADPNYSYGTHFLFQGHEAGSPGYITRIILDADGAHRDTLIAPQDTKDNNHPTFTSPPSAHRPHRL